MGINGVTFKKKKKKKTVNRHTYVYSVLLRFLNTYVTQHIVTIK